jgi:hypothetical protein
MYEMALLFQQVDEFVDREACVRDDAPERTGLSWRWSGTTTHAAGLLRRKIMWLPFRRTNVNPARSKAARTLRPDRSVGSLATSTGFDFYELFACFCGNRLASVTKDLDMELDRFADIGHGLIARVTLAVAAGQGRHASGKAAVVFLFQDNRVTHGQGLCFSRASDGDQNVGRRQR